MATFTPQAVALDNPVAPAYTAVNAADKFTAVAGKRYMLHYKNGATASGTVFINEQKAGLPRAAAATAPAGATKWSDAKLATAVGSNAELVVWIDDVTPYLDSTQSVNLQHAGTLTTLTLAIFGPF